MDTSYVTHNHTCQLKECITVFVTCFRLYYTHFEITKGPCNLTGYNWCDLFTNRTFFCFKSHLFSPGNGEATLRTKRLIRFQGLFKVTDQIAEKWETEYHVANFATFVSKTLTSSPQKMDEFNFRPAQYCINKMLEQT